MTKSTEPAKPTRSGSAEKTLLVIGLGMIGGSVLRAASKAGNADRILGYDSDPSCIQQAYASGLIRNLPTSLAELCAEASCIVIAAPPLAFDSVFAALADIECPENLVITDVASVKQLTLDACLRHAPELAKRYFPAHPIAGSEKSGLAHAKVDLFRDKKLILTPHPQLSDVARDRVQTFWAGLGCQLATLDPKIHDELLASTSHLPHVLAYVLVDSLVRHEHIDRLFEFAAGGFQDISRTASSDPTMWHDIFTANKEPVLRAVEAFQGRLDLFKELLEQDRGDELYEMLMSAKERRDDYLEKYRS